MNILFGQDAGKWFLLMLLSYIVGRLDMKNDVLNGWVKIEPERTFRILKRHMESR